MANKNNTVNVVRDVITRVSAGKETYIIRRGTNGVEIEIGAYSQFYPDGKTGQTVLTEALGFLRNTASKSKPSAVINGEGKPKRIRRTRAEMEAANAINSEGKPKRTRRTWTEMEAANAAKPLEEV